jgi:hypothetical protein
VHVLVHVCTGIPFISLRWTASLIDDVYIVGKRDMQILARACGALQNVKNQTQNPPTARSWGFDPPSRHQQNKELKLNWPLEIGEAKIVWWLF